MKAIWCSDGLDARRLGSVSWIALDIETTGLDPGRHAIREYAAFSVTSRGEVATVAAWEAEVQGADRFVAGLVEIANRIEAGDVLVAHNIAFDLSFLAVRPDVPDALLRPSAWMCTLRMLNAPRSLDRLASALGVTIEGRHSAAGDARGLADLLAAMLARSSDRNVTGVGAMFAGIGARAAGLAPRGAERVASGWSGIRAQVDHVVPIPAITLGQRVAFAGVARLVADRRHGPVHLIESDAIAAALCGAGVTACVLDILLEETP